MSEFPDLWSRTRKPRFKFCYHAPIATKRQVLIIQSTNQPTNQLINQSINQSIYKKIENQSLNILKSSLQNGRFLGERRQVQGGSGARNTRQVECSEERNSRLPQSCVSRASRLPRASLRAYLSYFLCTRK